MSENKQEKIIKMFDAIAPSYDRANRLLSLGLDLAWRKKTAQLALDLLPDPPRSRSARPPSTSASTPASTPSSATASRPLLIADLACGTGDMLDCLASEAAARGVEISKFLGLDPSEKMLEIAKKRFRSGAGGEAGDELAVVEPEVGSVAAGEGSVVGGDTVAAGVEFIQAEAGALPLENDSLDLVSMAFGLRNVLALPAALAELARVVRPGGLVVILEFTRREKSGPVGFLRDFYLTRILPKLGGWISHNRAAYEYLPHSIDDFLSAAELGERLEAAGLKMRLQSSFSLGIASLLIAQKCG